MAESPYAAIIAIATSQGVLGQLGARNASMESTSGSEMAYGLLSKAGKADPLALGSCSANPPRAVSLDKKAERVSVDSVKSGGFFSSSTRLI
jgi:hypothetical protein